MITRAHGEALDFEQSTALVPVLGLISAVWRRRLLVAIVTALTLIASLLLLMMMPPSYDASMVLAPAATEHNSASSLGGLASLGAAVGLNVSGNDDFEKFQLLMTSSIVAKKLEQQHENEVLSAMFPGQWSTATEHWEEPAGLRASIGRDLRTVFGLPGWVPPTDNSLANLLKRRVHVNRVPESDLVEVTFSDRDPQFARNLLFWLYIEADEQLRDAMLASALQQRDYVNQRLKSETVLEDRDALGAVLFQLEQKIMMGHAAGAYAAIVVDGPSVSNLPDSPKPVWFIVFGILFGFMFGTIASVVTESWRHSKGMVANSPRLSPRQPFAPSTNDAEPRATAVPPGTVHTKRVIGRRAGTRLRPAAKAHEIAWSDHRIRFFTSFARGKRVLDIGCVQHDPDNYRSPYWVHKALVAVADHVVGIDLYPEGVEYLRGKGYDVRLFDACDFDIGEKFDVIVAGDIIEHLDNVGGFLSSCRRSLRPDGVLLVTTDSPWFWRHIARAAVLGRVKNNLEHVTWIDPVLLSQLAGRFGFDLRDDEVSYGAREWWLRCVPLPAPIKFPTYHAVLRPATEREPPSTEKQAPH